MEVLGSMMVPPESTSPVLRGPLISALISSLAVPVCWSSLVLIQVLQVLQAKSQIWVFSKSLSLVLTPPSLPIHESSWSAFLALSIWGLLLFLTEEGPDFFLPALSIARTSRRHYFDHLWIHLVLFPQSHFFLLFSAKKAFPLTLPFWVRPRSEFCSCSLMSFFFF